MGCSDLSLTFILVWKSGAASILAVICVRTKPGEMLLTRMPWVAHSMARVWVMLRRAALVPPLLGGMCQWMGCLAILDMLEILQATGERFD